MFRIVFWDVLPCKIIVDLSQKEGQGAEALGFLDPKGFESSNTT
jgi:hypothetical protein